jgi:hypothetical protein
MGANCTAAPVEYRRGQWIEVRSAAEIAATLDADAKLDGLPFMPEMLAFCGRRLQVHRRAGRICVEGHGARSLRATVLRDCSAERATP